MAIIKLHPKRLRDADYIKGIENNNNKMVSDLYIEWVNYFKPHSYHLFFNLEEDKKDAMQEAFIELINKVRHGSIYVADDQVMGRNGKPFSCNLMTYLMSVAVNKKRELIRKKSQLKYWDEIFASTEQELNPTTPVEDLFNPLNEDIMLEIIARCLSIMPKRCKEILTMFYYEQKCLDEIMDFFSKNEEGIRSKDALKTRKNKCMNTLKDIANKEYSQYLNH